MTELVNVALSVLVLASSMIVRPTSATCPVGWQQDGITPDGYFSCSPELVGGDMDPRAYRPPGRIYGRIYCPSETMPVQLDERSLGCRKGHYQWQ